MNETNVQVPMIRLENATKRYLMGEVPVAALDGGTLEIRRGEFVSIMGPSGSGKSTLLNILGALDTLTEGRYLLEGHDITQLSDRELARIRNRHFGFVFQAYNLFQDMSALENVELPLVYAGVHPRERRKRATERLEAVGLSHRLRHYPTQLSGGEQQRVAIARALVNEPTLLLADEPTGNLPTHQGDEIMKIFADLNAQGMTVAIVTHDPRIGARAKRQIRLSDGKIVADEPIVDGILPTAG